MKQSKVINRGLARCLAIVLLITPTVTNLGTYQNVKAAENVVQVGSGSYSTVVKGNYSWQQNGTTVYAPNQNLVDALPYHSATGNSRLHVTSNYQGPLDTSDWATSFLWDFQGSEPYSHSVYAIPLAYKGSSEGMYITNPSTIIDNVNNAYLKTMPENGSLTDFVITPSFSTSDAKVDKVTDWSYDVIMANSSNASQYMKASLVQGSPFGFFDFVNSNTVTIGRKRALPATVTYYNGTSLSNSSMIVVRCFDNQDGDYDYYAFYAPTGTKWTVNTSGDRISNINVVFPSSSGYLTASILCSTKTNTTTDDANAKAIANEYKKYAYNFITNTTADYSYNATTHIVTTNYTYTVAKKAESTADGTIMGILPHQYKNMSTTSYLPYTYQTIRGTMKTMAGSTYQTQLKFTGILPNMPGVGTDASTVSKLTGYLNEFMSKSDYMNINTGNKDTYWQGKALNRLSNVLAIAEKYGSSSQVNTLYQTLKGELENWFTTTPTEDEKYFYYDDKIGAMFGFPQDFGSIDQINDHHFHYGYFIYAAAQVALRDPSWASDSNYGSMIKMLIDDIACNDRNSSKFPYLRNFSPYEGHSWASGHAAFSDGNNQESSSEAINAWAGIILFAEATHNTALRDLGIYLYTTEISAVDNYWFDIDKNVLADEYRYNVSNASTINKATAKVVRNQASMIWGGKSIYGTWWTAEPLQVQGINLLPINPYSFYLAKDKQYILDNWKLALENEAASTCSDKLGSDYATYTDRWNDVWSEYLALSNPDTALSYWDPSAAEESGETRAHTYNYIMALKNYGTPDLTITSNVTMSSVFNKNGVKTYSAFNPDDTAKTVTFSDGGSIVVPAHSQYTGASGTTGSNPGTTPTATPVATATPSAAVQTPTFSLAAGTYTSTQQVTMSSQTSGASIRYTTDGTEPTESSTLYSGALSISKTTTVKAKAYKSGMTASQTASAVYTITTTSTNTVIGQFKPSFNYDGTNLTITLTPTVSGATATNLWYTDITNPTQLSQARAGYALTNSNGVFKVTISNVMLGSNGLINLYLVTNKGDTGWVAFNVTSGTGQDNSQTGTGSNTGTTTQNVTFSGKNITFYAKDLSSTESAVILYFKTYSNLADAQSRATSASLSDVPGYTMSYQSASSAWIYTKTADTSTTNGSYILYKYGAVGKQLTDWQIVQISGLTN